MDGLLCAQYHIFNSGEVLKTSQLVPVVNEKFEGSQEYAQRTELGSAPSHLTPKPILFASHQAASQNAGF